MHGTERRRVKRSRASLVSGGPAASSGSVSSSQSPRRQPTRTAETQPRGWGGWHGGRLIDASPWRITIASHPDLSEGMPDRSEQLPVASQTRHRDPPAGWQPFTLPSANSIPAPAPADWLSPGSTLIRVAASVAPTLRATRAMRLAKPVARLKRHRLDCVLNVGRPHLDDPERLQRQR